MKKQTHSEDFWGHVGTRINYRQESIVTMTNAHLVNAIRQIHFFKYKTPEQTETYSTLMAELTKRQKAGTI